MKNILLIIAIALVILAAFLYYDGRMSSTAVVTPPQQATSTTSEIPPTIISGTPSALYQDSTYGFSIAYPATASIETPDSYSFGGYLPLTQTPVVGLALPQSLFTGTNLGEAGVYIGATTTPAIVAVCSQADSMAANERAVASTTISGTPFSVFSSTDVGAGNIYDETIYRGVENGACFEIVELLHSGNIENYPKGKVTQFDRSTFESYLDAMVNSLAFGSSAATQ